MSISSMRYCIGTAGRFGARLLPRQQWQYLRHGCDRDLMWQGRRGCSNFHDNAAVIERVASTHVLICPAVAVGPAWHAQLGHEVNALYARQTLRIAHTRSSQSDRVKAIDNGTSIASCR